MKKFRKRIFVTAGYNTVYFGSGRPDFDPSKPMRSFEEYLLETAQGTLEKLPEKRIDEGMIGSFMSSRFLKQANLPAFLPFMVPELEGKACTAIEGACGTGGRLIAMAVRSILSDLSEVVFVSGFEMQNTVKAVYGADILAGAGYYAKERKKGGAFFFPHLFANRAGAYFEKYGEEKARQAMAKWYEQAILHARKNPKAQEYRNERKELLAFGMMPANPKQFVPYLNQADCSKVTDGASSLIVLSEEGLERLKISPEDAIEIIGLGEAEASIEKSPEDLTRLETTEIAVKKAFDQAEIIKKDLSLLEVHDCFSITGLLTFEAIGLAKRGEGADFILQGLASSEGEIPTNLSGGLIGFGHPTGASGVRQMVDLWEQLTLRASNQLNLSQTKKHYGMMISMGGDDKTVTAIIVT